MRKNPLNIAAVICAALFLSSGCTADPAEDTKPVKVELPQDIEKCLVKPPKEPLACTMQYDLFVAVTARPIAMPALRVVQVCPGAPRAPVVKSTLTIDKENRPPSVNQVRFRQKETLPQEI